MKNRDKYESFDALKAAFVEFCKGRRAKIHDCQFGFGCAPRLAACVLCYEMWKDSDTEAEERAAAAAREERLARERERDAFEASYPGLFYDKNRTSIPDTTSLYDCCMFSVRAMNTLDKAKVGTVGQLLALSPERIADIKGVGKVTLDEITRTQTSLSKLRDQLDRDKNLRTQRETNRPHD